MVTSTGAARTSAPVAWRISSAVDSSVDRVRAQRASLAPSLASPMATARPRPSLDAATMATRPFKPRSITSPPYREIGGPEKQDGTGPSTPFAAGCQFVPDILHADRGER